MTSLIRPLILCGGAGARLWPTSRESLPKQFAPLLGQRSTFQDTVLRAQRAGLGRPVIMINQVHRHLALQQLAELSVQSDVLVEPVRRDSAPAIVAGCLAIGRQDPETLVLVLASDHLVRDEAAFNAAVEAGVPAAREGHLVTFGVTPTHPEQNYGYIEPGSPLAGSARSVVRFAEKPAADVAARYVAEGMLWNSGNFLFRASALLGEYGRLCPQSLAAIKAAVEAATPCGGARVLGGVYEQAAATSIDYAVMERASRAAVVSMACGWSDIGTWDALWSCSPHDDAGNAVNGSVEIVDSTDCLVSSSGLLTAVVGLRDIVVVADRDAILVADRKHSGEVKTLVNRMRLRGRSEADAHARVHRPWGWYQVTDGGSQFQVKRITVNPGGRLSLQKHFMRAEHWVVVSGEAKVTVGDEVGTFVANQHVHIPLGAVHRLENMGTEPVELIEVQTGLYLGEDDIVRLEDAYERV